MDQVREEVDTLRRQLAQALAREKETAEAIEDERRAAGQKIAELEDAIVESKREGALLRERTEGRLEKLRLAAEEEEEENGSQVFMRVLWWRGAVQMSSVFARIVHSCGTYSRFLHPSNMIDYTGAYGILGTR